MARRRHNGPPLYDLITTHSRSQPAPVQKPEQPRETQDEQAAESLGWVNPGRKVAFPVGYVFVAVAIALTVAILAYVFGHTRGEEIAEASIDESLRDAWLVEDQARKTSDPLLASRTGEYQPPSSNIQPEAKTRNQPRPSAERSPSTSGAMPIIHDPRQPGQNYFVLATTRRDGAIRLAEFCRARGLEAFVVGGHNARLSQVIVLPALHSTASSDPLTRSMREQIGRIGREWERSEPGATDLSDAYVQLKK